MPIQINNDESNNLIEVRVTGKLVKEDYSKFVPELERMIKSHGKLRILFEMIDFHGWTVTALWEDLKFDLKHFRDVDRLAMVGDKKWEKGMSFFCKPFTSAEIRYFDQLHRDDALAWLAANQPTHVGS